MTVLFSLAPGPWPLAPFAFAQEAPQRTVTAVEVRNNKNVAASTILSKLRTRPGAPFSQATINEDLKSLYGTGYFADVSVDLSDFEGGVKVAFVVREKPLLKNIRFEGNRIIVTKKLEKAVKSKLDEILDRRKLKEDADEVKKLYDKRGFTLAQITYTVDVDDETNQATVIFKIDEGVQLKVKRIEVQGNKAFGAGKIRKLMQTKAAGPFKSGALKDDVLAEDLDRVKVFYENAGYIDAKVDKEVQVDPAGKKAVVIMKVAEGKKYLVGDVALSGNVIFPDSDLKKKVSLKPGSTFSPQAIRNDGSALQSFYFDKGYIFANVAPEDVLNNQTGKVDVHYKIEEYEIAYIDRIIVRGNVKTKDIVIRRQLRMLPGERFNGEKVKRSKERLYNLGYFEEVSFDTEEAGLPEKRNLVVDVKESKTGEFSFGGGFGTVDRFVGFVEVAQRNFDWRNFPSFTGGGQELRLRAQLGSVRRDFELSFTEPWAFGTPTLLGLDAFNRKRERSSTSGYAYDQEELGFDIRFGRELGEYFHGGVGYELEQFDIKQLPDTISEDIRKEAGQSLVSAGSLRFVRDTRDNVYSPTKGNVSSLGFRLGGGPFLGDKDFYKVIGETDFYFPAFKNHVLETRLRAGVGNNFGNTERMPLFERFFVGGAETVRGYEERRIGPKDKNTNDPIGGKTMAIGNLEYTVPVIQFLKVAGFYDVGTVTANSGDFFGGKYQHGVGLGVRIKTPVGPVKLDVGYPLNAEPGEDSKPRVHFNMQRSF